MNSLIKVVTLSCLLFIPAATWACDAAGPSAHVGMLMSVDAGKKSFTIKDAQTQQPITFVTDNDDILSGLKEAKGSIMVKFEEDGSNLKAVGVTF